MTRRQIETALIITSDNAGGVKALVATDKQVRNLNKSVNVTRVSVDKFNKSVNSSSKTFKSLSRELKGALGVVSGGLLIRETIRIADAMQSLDARLKLVTDNTFEYARAQQAVRDISSETFQSLEAVGTFYARIENATKGTSISQEQLLIATQALNNAFRSYGVSGSEAASATLQLSQALAKGKLDGDEFRSVLENAPPVVDALIKELGIAKKELFEFSKEGKIGVEDLVNALVNSADDFAEASAAIPTKASEAITILKNQYAIFIAESDTAKLATTALTQTILFLAENIEGLIKVIAAGAAIKLLAPTLNAIGAAALTSLAGINRLGVGLVAANAKAATLTATTRGLKASLALLGGPAGVLALTGIGLYKLSEAMSEAAREGNIFLNTADRVNASLGQAIGIDNLEDAEKAFEKIRREVEKLDAAIRQQEQAMSTQTYLDPSTQEKIINDLKRQKQALEGQIAVSEKLNAVLRKGRKIIEDNTKSQDKNNKSQKSAKEIEAERLKQAKEREEIERELNQLLGEYGTAAEKIALIEEERKQAMEAFNAAGLQSQGVIDALNKKFTEQKKRIEESSKVLTKQQKLWREYDQLIADLSIDNTEREFVLLEARIEEMAMKMNLSAEEVHRLKEALYELREASEDTGKSIEGIGEIKFGQGFNQLISQGFKLQDIFKKITTGFTEGLQGGLQSIALIGQGLQSIRGLWDSTAGDGRDTAGRILETANGILSSFGPLGETISQIVGAVNSLTGGKLFGTSFERQSSNFNVDIGAAGASGFTETIDVRQRSLFRGRQWRREIEQLAGESLDAILAVFNQMETDAVTLADALGTEAAAVLSATFRQEFDKDGSLTLSQSVVGGRTFNDQSFDEFALRAVTQQRIAALDAAFDMVERQITETLTFGPEVEGVLGELTRTRTALIGEASAITEAYQDNVEQLADVTDALVAAGIAIKNGEGLTDSLTTSFELIEELINPTESFAGAFNRLQAQTQLTQDAVDLLGVSLNLGQADLVRFSDTLAESVGGLPRLTDLWSNFITQFLSPEQLLTSEIRSVSDLLAQQAQNIGVDSSISESDFAQLFQQRFPELTAEQVGQWLEFADSLSRVNDLTAQHNQLLAEQAERVQAYNDFANGLRTELGLLTGTTSQYSASVAEIRRQESQNIATLQRLAEEAGLAGAAEIDLANAHQLATNQILRAQEALRSTILSGIDELYGDDLENRIAELEASQISSINNVGQASENFYAAQLRGLRRLRDTVNDVLFDENLSPLEREEQLQLALTQFYDAVEAFNNGDTSALDDINDLYRTAVEIARDTRASGDDFNQIVFGLNDIINGLEVNASPPGSVGGQGGGGGVSQELQNLYDERDARLEQQTTEHRLRLATQLAQQLAEYSAAVQRPVLDLLGEFNVNLVTFLNDLGVNVENATGETVAQLAAVANTFGIELTELSAGINETVSLNLGDLADRQSLLNDGLETILNSIPAEFRDRIAPLLTAVEEAADGEAQELALQNLEAATADLPIEYRNQLAPFFDNIDVTTEAREQVTLLTEQNNTALTALGVQEEQAEYLSALQLQSNVSNEWLRQIANSLDGSGGGPAAPGDKSLQKMDELVGQVRSLKDQQVMNAEQMKRLTRQIAENTSKTANQTAEPFNPSRSRVA